MRKRMSVAEAKATFAARIREVEGGEPVLITRHGRPVAALVPVEELEQLDRLRAAGPQGGLASLAGGWDGSEELVRDMENSPRSGPREVADLD